MNSGANDEKSTAYSVATRSKEENGLNHAWQYTKRDHTKPRCRGQGSVSGLDVVGVTLITAISALVVSRFHDNGIWALADRFPVSICPSRHDFPD